MPEVAGRAPSGAGESRPAHGQARTFLAILLGRSFAKTVDFARRLGLLTLFGGLTLVALTALRLPGGIGGAADPFLAVSLLCASWLAWRRGIRVRAFAIHGLGLLLLSSGAALAALHGADPIPTFAALAKFLFATTLMFLTCALLIDRRELVVTAIGCWVVSTVVTSGVAVLQAQFGDAIPGAESEAWGRLAGLTSNPNGLGVIAGMAIGPALSLAAQNERLAVRTVWLAAAMVNAASIALSASRSGAVVAGVCLVLWAALNYRLNRRFTLLVICCCLAAATVAGFLHVHGQYLSERFSVAATDPASDQAIQSRLDQYNFVLQNASKNFFLGSGLSPNDATAYGQAVHNTFLLVLRGGGILAFLGFGVIIGDLLRTGLQCYARARSPDAKVIALGLLTATVGLLLAGMAGPVLYQREVWVPAGLLVAFRMTRRRKRAAVPPGSARDRRRLSQPRRA